MDYSFFLRDPPSVWVVRILDGEVAVQETATVALAEVIGPRLRSARAVPRFRAEYRREKWGVVDGRTPGRVYMPGITRAQAQLRAACWACAEALRAGAQRRFGIHDVFASREEAETEAGRLRGLRAARLRAGLSLAAAARLYGRASAGTISAWERHKRLPSPDYIKLIEGAGRPRPATYFVVRPDGTIEEVAAKDLAAVIGCKVDTPAGPQLRWQAVRVDGRWGVVDARWPDEVVREAVDEDEAETLAAEWNIEAGLARDLSRLGIHVIADSRDEAEAAARDLKE